MANNCRLMLLVLFILFVFVLSFTDGESTASNKSSNSSVTKKSQSSCRITCGHGLFYQKLDNLSLTCNEESSEKDELMNGISDDLSFNRFWSSGFGFSSHYETLPVAPPIPAELL
ncbi:unnamed protein product [Orchesella dallaii]|uniref:Uncharacterized protein n=1 Tax=Orchesella dallaii TaxID=48710 RepID=A0ABP1QM18_9HEXA